MMRLWCCKKSWNVCFPRDLNENCQRAGTAILQRKSKRVVQCRKEKTPGRSCSLSVYRWDFKKDRDVLPSPVVPGKGTMFFD